MSIHHFATAKGHPLLQFPCSIDMPGDLSITVEALCKGLPTSFCNFISHVRSLDFDRKLNYQYLHSILSWVSKSETAKIDQPNNVLPPTHSHPLPSAHSHPSLSAHSHPSPSAHSHPLPSSYSSKLCIYHLISSGLIFDVFWAFITFGHRK
jgi:hypothetical protein